MEKIKEYNATIIWPLAKSCNLSCEYCVNPEVSEENAMNTKIKINRFISVIGQTKKTFNIILGGGGGEPFIVPNILEICKKSTEDHFISIITNLTSPRIKEFSESIDPKDVVLIWASFHLKELEKRSLLEVYVNNFYLLKKKGFNIVSGIVAYPPLIKDFKAYKEMLKDKGIEILYQPFSGVYRKRLYPWAYSQEELEVLGFKDKDQLLNTFKSHDKVCSVGYNIASIDYKGNIVPCLKIPISLGNIKDGFRFNDHLIRCPEKYCLCPPFLLEPYLHNKAKNVKINNGYNNRIFLEELHRIINKKIGELGLLIKEHDQRLYQDLLNIKTRIGRI